MALPVDADDNERAVFDEVMSTAPAVLASFQHLEELHIDTEPLVLCRAMPVLAAELTALSQLRLLNRLNCAYSDVACDTSIWSDIFTHLCQLNLQRLHLIMDAWPDDVSVGGPGLAALRPLSQLSSLVVRGWPCFKSEADCKALASMTQLQCLEFYSYTRCLTADDCPYDAVVRALLALTALTSLAVHCDDELRQGSQRRAGSVSTTGSVAGPARASNTC